LGPCSLRTIADAVAQQSLRFGWRIALTECEMFIRVDKVDIMCYASRSSCVNWKVTFGPAIHAQPTTKSAFDRILESEQASRAGKFYIVKILSSFTLPLTEKNY